MSLGVAKNKIRRFRSECLDYQESNAIVKNNIFSAEYLSQSHRFSIRILNEEVVLVVD